MINDTEMINETEKKKKKDNLLESAKMQAKEYQCSTKNIHVT